MYSKYFLLLVLVTLIYLQGAGQINLDSGLVGYYKLDGNTSDASVSQIFGTPNSIISTLGKNGLVNTAYSFNGTNSQIDCGVDNRGIVDTVTISAWIKTTTTNLSFIVGKYDWVADKGFHLVVNNGEIGLAGRNNGGQYVSTVPVSTGNFVADGNWHFAVAEVAGNSWTLWLDCNQVGQIITNVSTPLLWNSESLTIGYYDKVNSAPEQFFDGDIDEVRVYNRVLSNSERSLICDVNYEDPILSAPTVSNDTLVCADSLYTLRAIPDSGLIYWQSPLGVNVGTGNTFITSSSQNQTFHVFSVLNGIYSDTSIINVTVQNCFNFNAPIGPNDTLVCVDSVFTMSATSDSGTIYWESPLGTVIGSGNTLTTSINYTSYVYMYSVSNGFYSDTLSVLVTTMDCSGYLDAPDITNDTVVCSGGQFTLNANVNAGVTNWINENGDLLGYGNTLTTTITEATTFYAYVEYNVQVTDTSAVTVTVEDCSVSVVAQVFSDSNLVWPNIFTPNGDGINDNFVLEIPYTSCLIGSVYNRWGVAVYECKNVAFSWNGSTNNGEKLSSGVYFYLVSYCVNDETISRKGTVYLMRGE